MKLSLSMNEVQLFDTIIIGGGAAGCQCGLWLRMLGYNPIILEKSAKLGGLQNQSPYENHWIACVPDQTGVHIAESMSENIIRHGVPHIKNIKKSKIAKDESGKFVVELYTDFSNYTLRAPKLVIASGVDSKSGGFVSSNKVLIGSGYIIQNHEFLNKKVAILGGGDTAAENYLFIKDKGAKNITIFARTLRARPQLIEKIPKKSIVVGEFNANQRLMKVNDEIFDIFCIMYGWKPLIPLPKELYPKLTGNGFIQADNHCRTSEKNIFAIGECTQRVHPCVTTAMADGVIAAKAIQYDFEL